MKQIVPRNHVYLLGDNIDNSDDLSDLEDHAIKGKKK